MTEAKKITDTKKEKTPSVKVLAYPGSSLEKALRIPKFILEQNAGKAAQMRNLQICLSTIPTLCVGMVVGMLLRPNKQ